MSKIQNIVFDMGGVIVDIDIPASIEAFEKLGYAEIRDILDPYLQSGILLKLEEGTATPQEFYEHVRKTAPHLTDKDINEALYVALTGIKPYKLNMLLELRKKYKIYMLSNTNAIMFNHIANTMFTAEGRTVDDYFDHLFLSYKMHLVKPYEPIFEEMIRQSGMVPDETLFIDDAPANVATAGKLGLMTYQPKPDEDFRHIFDSL